MNIVLPYIKVVLYHQHSASNAATSKPKDRLFDASMAILPPCQACDNNRKPGKGFRKNPTTYIRNLQNPISRVPVDEMAPKFFHMLLGAFLRSPEKFSWILGDGIPLPDC